MQLPKNKIAAKKTQPDTERSSIRKLIGAIGGITAVISLLLLLNQVTGLVQAFRIHHKEFSELLKAGQQQEERGDYPAAFESFKRASDIDPIDRKAQDLEVQAVMLWLENMHPDDKKFSDSVDPLLPVLDKALSHSKGIKAADLLSHIGWANFLRSRDLRSRGGPLPEGMHIEQSYEQALRIDPENVYAHAMWGHWILWEYGELRPALEHFAAAIQSERRLRPYVRHLQLNALYNSSHDAANPELFRVANEMRRNQESIALGDRQRAFDECVEFRLDRHDELRQVLKVISPKDALATYDWLSQDYTKLFGDPTTGRQRREFVVAFLSEISGNESEAVSRYKSLQREIRESRNFSMLDSTAEGLKRLSSKPR